MKKGTLSPQVEKPAYLNITSKNQIFGENAVHALLFFKTGLTVPCEADIFLNFFQRVLFHRAIVTCEAHIARPKTGFAKVFTTHRDNSAKDQQPPGRFQIIAALVRCIPNVKGPGEKISQPQGSDYGNVPYSTL